MLVRDVMSSPAVTVAPGASLHDATGKMLNHQVGSVVVTPDGDGTDALGGDDTGIVTQSDVLRAAHRTNRPLVAIGVDAAASSPLVTISPDRTVRLAVDEMVEEEIKRLVVVDGFDIVGVVTLSDVALEYSEIRSEAIDLAGRSGQWN